MCRGFRASRVRGEQETGRSYIDVVSGGRCGAVGCWFQTHLVLGEGDLHVIVIAMVEHVDRLLAQLGDAAGPHRARVIGPRQQQQPDQERRDQAQPEQGEAGPGPGPRRGAGGADQGAPAPACPRHHLRRRARGFMCGCRQRQRRSLPRDEERVQRGGKHARAKRCAGESSDLVVLQLSTAGFAMLSSSSSHRHTRLSKCGLINLCLRHPLLR